MEKIFYNGKIITMEYSDVNQELINTPEAVWVKDGIIAGTGKLSEMEKIAGSDTAKIDLQGKCLMPAFIDAHSHIIMNGQMSMLADLSECESFADIIASLKEYIRKNNIEKDGVVVGFGYDHNFLKEGAQPDKRVLNQVSEEVPIFILHVSGHLGCANSAALKLAGIGAETPAPHGGVIGRLEKSNEPSGYVEEAGMNLLQQAVMPRIKVDFLQMGQKMQSVYIENGVTTVQDGASTENDINALISMNASGDLKVDVVSYPLMSAGGVELMHKYGEQYENYSGHLKLGGYKLVLDGSPQGRSAWMSEPYLGGEGGYCGYPWLKDDVVLEYVSKAVVEKRQILAHCNGDAASEQFLNSYEQAVKENGCKENLRPVMIHCQTVRNDQLDRMAKLNMIASIFVGHVWYWGDIHMRNFGEQRGNHISPAKDALERRVLVNFHQDTPVTKPNMLHSVWCAVNRVSRGGNLVGKDQAISVYDALKAVTINAAYQYYEEDSKGSITKGKRADLIILDQSPLEVNQSDIRNIKVLETIKDGESIFTSE